MTGTDLPSNIQIGAYDYTVKVSNKALAKAMPGLPAVGAGLMIKQQILLAQGMAPDFAADTLLHEILHQCNAVGNGPDDDESWVAAVTGPLLQVIRANPGLWDYLCYPSPT